MYFKPTDGGENRWRWGPTWDSTSAYAYIVSSDDTPPSSGYREYCDSAWGDSALGVVDTAERQVSGTACKQSYEGIFSFKEMLNGKPGPNSNIQYPNM